MKKIIEKIVEQGYNPNEQVYYVGVTGDKSRAYTLLDAVRRCRPGYCVVYRKAGTRWTVTERDSDGIWYY